MNSRCRPVRHTQPALPIGLPVPPTQQVDSESDEELDESDELDPDFDFSDADRYTVLDGGGWSKMKVSFSVSSQSILKRFLWHFVNPIF